MSLLDEIRAKRDAILTLATRHGVANVRVFGSVVRGQENENSDVDFLITIDPSRSLIELIRFRLDLQALLTRECDVVSERGLHRLIRDHVLNEAMPL